jgi:hypothetical protein
MKIIVVPNGLLQLPYPWCLISEISRDKQIKALPPNGEEIQTSLRVFSQTLYVFSQLILPEGNSIPEEINDNWNFSIEAIAGKIPTLDEFNIVGIQEFLKENGIEQPSTEMIEEIAESLFWTVAYDLANASSQWLEKTLTVNQDATAIASFLDIVTRYWQQTDRRLAGSLIIKSTRVAGKDAIPLLEAVENTSTDDSLRELAQSYHNLILDR